MNEKLQPPVGVDNSTSASNGLERFASTWSAKDVAEFEAAAQFTKTIEDEICHQPETDGLLPEDCGFVYLRDQGGA